MHIHIFGDSFLLVLNLNCQTTWCGCTSALVGKFRSVAICPACPTPTCRTLLSAAGDGPPGGPAWRSGRDGGRRAQSQIAEESCHVRTESLHTAIAFQCRPKHSADSFPALLQRFG